MTGTPVRSELAALDRSAEGQADGPRRAGTARRTGRRWPRSVDRSARGASTVPWPRWLGPGGTGRTVDRRGAGRDRSLYHVTGRRDYEEFALGADDTGADAGDNGRSTTGSFPSRTTCQSSTPAADVCVSRSGAMTVAELLIAGVPAILVPLPGAPRDHQTKNAEALVRIGAAVQVPDPECDGRRLAAELDALLSDPARLPSDARGGRRVWAIPMPRPGWPSWWMPMPAEDGTAGVGRAIVDPAWTC